MAPFKLEAVEASLCQFFENWWLKLKCPNLLKPLGSVIQQNNWSFYPSEPFSFVHFNMIHPVCEYLVHYRLHSFTWIFISLGKVNFRPKIKYITWFRCANLNFNLEWNLTHFWAMWWYLPTLEFLSRSIFVHANKHEPAGKLSNAL